MKTLKDIYETSILSKEFEDDFNNTFPCVYKPTRRIWKFANSSFGELWSANKQLGFYEYFDYSSGSFVVLYVTPEIKEKYLDKIATAKQDGDGVPTNDVKSVAIDALKLTAKNPVSIWDCNDYVSTVDMGSVPELDGNNLGWRAWIKSFERFFKVKFNSTAKEQIQWSKGEFN